MLSEEYKYLFMTNIFEKFSVDHLLYVYTPFLFFPLSCGIAGCAVRKLAERVRFIVYVISYQPRGA